MPVGDPLPPFRPSPLFSRTRFAIRIASHSDAASNSVFIVDIDYDESRALLYRDEALIEKGEMPTKFEVPGGTIEVTSSGYGMRRIHMVDAKGTETRLTPTEGTPEHGRARLRERFPRLSRGLGIAAVVVLIVDLILLALQALEFVSGLDVWNERLGLPEFTSPIVLPLWLNVGLAISAGLAAFERALTFRHHPVLDIETIWLDGVD